MHNHQCVGKECTHSFFMRLGCFDAVPLALLALRQHLKTTTCYPEIQGTRQFPNAGPVTPKIE